ncbi:MAG TPA: hypothetical protein PK725_12220 [Rhodocyclaceae bacterium]|nr:hypothetical protein [Rhodocyclaceae bacterium]
MYAIRNILMVTACLWNMTAFALEDLERQRLQHLQARWAEINYQVPDKEREAAFAALQEEAEQAVAQAPDSPELLIWRGIILSSRAGAKGGLGALDLVKKAKVSLEAAMSVDPKALDGSAYTSLGSLYYQVPGWPIGFGSGEKAEAMLREALAINPDGIDPNYFYGDYLFREKRYDEARSALLRALAAGDRPGRETADEGRREEIRALLGKVTAKLD